MKRKDAMLEKMRDYREIVMDAIDYDNLLRDIPQDRDRVDEMRENTTKVRNIKQYLLTALYNTPATIGNYYTSRVQHDFYGNSPHG